MKYTVNVAVNARLDVEVEANSFEEAMEKATLWAGDEDWNKMECVDMESVCAYDENGKEFYS